MKNRIRKYIGDSLILKRRREKARKDANQQKGLCDCGHRPPIKNKKRCQECIDASSARRKKRRDARKQNGLCTECKMKTNGKNLCIVCQDKHKALVKSIKEQRIIDQNCTRCGKLPSHQCIKYCLPCYLKTLAWSLWKDRTRWKELLELFEQQNGTCPYFQETIVIGLNAALDHKIPKKLGGTNHISNLQWVNKIANTMKWDLTEKEFLSNIEKLAQNINNSRL